MPAPEIIITNANIITIDPACPQASALAISNGCFSAIGTNAEILPLGDKHTEVMDLAGKTVLPGFIDAHLHVLLSGVRHVLSVDCSGPGIEDIINALREKAAETPPGSWIRGILFDDTKVTEKRMITRGDLDKVSTEHMIFVSHRGFHTHICNSKALECAGIHKGDSPPTGGKYDYDEASGELNGVLHERACENIRNNLLPKATPGQRRQGLMQICSMLNASGITSVNDGKVTAEDMVTYEESLAADELTLRVGMMVVYDCMKNFTCNGIPPALDNEMLNVIGIKLFSDGAIAGRTAYLSQPYEGSSDNYGILAIEPAELDEKVMAIHKSGFRPCVHANGDAAIELVLDAYEKALAALPKEDARPRIEHCTVITPAIVQRLKSLGCVVTPFCTYIYYHGDKMKFYGAERLERMFAHRTFIDNGIVSTGASDYIPGPFEPLMGIQSCVTRTDSDGNLWGPSQKISVAEALKIYTINGAYSTYEEDLKGSITPGKLADLVVLAADPGAVNPFEIKDIPVEMTMLGGRVVYSS